MKFSSRCYHWPLFLTVSAVKVLLLPSYRSTDFEVHRNWLAVTSSLPIDRWYKDETSQWTLDYPPLFAWFEKFLSLVANWFDPSMLVIENLNYDSVWTVAFQRLSVIVSDYVLFYAVTLYVNQFVQSKQKASGLLCQPQLALVLLVAANTGLFIVDHIHFQYNGFLFGVMIISILRICQERYVEGAIWFAALLNLKHIYLYIAPAFGIFILRNYCFTAHKGGKFQWSSFSVLRFVAVVIAGLSVFAISFGPFVLKSQLFVVLARLFPFKRGLCHAYWAPNFWALYNVADKVLTVAGIRFGLIDRSNASLASMTGGLVQEFQHTVLPSIQPWHTLALTVLAIVPVVSYTLKYATTYKHFIRCVVMCSYCAFMFGWHVHEKAILLMIIPLTLLTADSKKDAALFLLLTTVGHFSLFPLIYTPAEMCIKYSLFLLFMVYSFNFLGESHKDNGRWYRLPLLSILETAYVFGLVLIELYCQGIHYFSGMDRSLPFLPLMITSVYCAVGVTYIWIKSYWTMLTGAS